MQNGSFTGRKVDNGSDLQVVLTSNWAVDRWAYVYIFSGVGKVGVGTFLSTTWIE